MIKQSIFTPLIKPYNLLFRDVKRIFFLLPNKLRASVLILFALMGLQAAFELLTIISMTHIGKAMGGPSDLDQIFPYDILFTTFPELHAWAVATQQNFILLASSVVVAFVSMKNLVTFYTLRATSRVSENISLNIGVEMMNRYLYSDYRWHISRASGTALQMMMWRGNIATLLVVQLSAITGFLTCAVLFAGMIVQEPYLSGSVMITTVLIGVLLYSSLRRSIDRTAQLSAQSMASEGRALMAATRGIRDVLIYGQQPAFLRSFSSFVSSGMEPRIFLTVANTMPSLCLEVVGFVMIPATIVMMVQAWQASMAEIVPAVMLLMLTAWRVLPYLNRGVGQMVAIRGVRPTALPVLEFLQTLRANSMTLPPPPNPDFVFAKDIRLEDVSFSYPDTQKESLHDTNMVIPRGKFIGLIGASGAGKSTAINILSGLCSPSTGRFLVDGKELEPADMAAFRRQVGFVPQSPFLMAGTLAENVAFSQWGKPYDPQQVMKACKQAAVDFIGEGEGGILLPIGENGVGLSGGQAQRVSIARALYANPSILIFDEATSALDAGNENIVVSSIERLRGSITCIIIAHRLTTVQNCDLLFWFDKGHIIAQGTPQEILPQYEASYDGVLV